MDRPVDLTDDVDLSTLGPVDLHDPARRAEVEAAVCDIPAVIAARLVPGFERPIDELHTLTTLGRGPKHIVRDVQSMLMARFGITTDHRVISVVQMEPERTALRPGATRILIDRVTVAHQGLSVGVDVELADEEGTYRGTADGPASAAGRWRAAARATLDAVRPRLREGCVVEIVGSEVTRVMGETVALCVVHSQTPQGAHTVVGSALVRDDEAAAVARSVLDALNRRVEEARG